jgi:uncharacterized protein (DUF58 family)
MSDLLILLIVFFVLAFTLRVDFIYYVFYVCLGLYVAGQFLTPRIVRGLRLSRVFNQNAYLGDQVDVQVTISNKSWLPIPWLRADESVPPVLRIGTGANHAMSFRSRESKTITYKVKAMKRGYYRLGPLLVSAGDFFGIREINNRLPADYLTVFPRIIRLSHLGLPSRLPYGTIPSRHRLFEDPARPIGIRDYRSGDSMRHINWKVSAHQDNLLVRTFEPVKSLESLILLNLNLNDYSRQIRYDGPEWAIVVAASIAAHLNSRRQSVGLTTNGLDPLNVSKVDAKDFDQETGRLRLSSLDGKGGSVNDQEQRSAGSRLITIPSKPGREHLMKILERLARIELREGTSFADWVPRACAHLSWGITILAISPTSDERTCGVLHQLVRAGYNPVLILVDPYVDFRVVRNRAHSLGFQAFQMGREQDLVSWRSPVVSAMNRG